MKKGIYVLAVTLIIASLVISTTASLSIKNFDPDKKDIDSDNETRSSQNDDSIIQRLMRLLTGEIIDADISDSAAINASKIEGVPSHNHDERYYTQAEVDALIDNITKVVNGIKPHWNTSYIPGTGYLVPIIVDTGYTLTGALATGYQTDLGGNPTGLIRIETNVNGSNLEFRVYDSAGNEPNDAGWPPNTRVRIDYLAILAK